MKTMIRIFSVLLLLTCCMPAGAQVLRDADYNSIGRIAGNGLVRDLSQRSVGSFEPDGTIRDKAGVAVGRISRLEIFDASGARVGYINNDGSVRDGESRPLGKIGLSDGKVVDASGKLLGYARGIRVDWIACYYFFNFFGALPK